MVMMASTLARHPCRRGARPNPPSRRPSPSSATIAGSTALRSWDRAPRHLSSHSSATAAAPSASSTSQEHKYPRLFTPLDLGPDIGVLPNRALMGSMHTGLEGTSMPQWMERWLQRGSASAKGDDDHAERMAAYFQERAQGGVGLMVTGGIAPSVAGWTGPFSSTLSSPSNLEFHRIVTDAVHSVQVPMGYSSHESVPGRICMQILHTGRYGYHPFVVSASTTKSPISPFKASGLTRSGIQKTVKDFVNAAVLAKTAGYDGVEIMASEGYLLSQFLSPLTNKRTDEYGGSLENRARLPLEIVRQTRAAVGADFIILFRLSLLDLVPNGLYWSESKQLCRSIQEAGCTLINTGIGWHEARVPTIATSVPRGGFAFPTQRLYRELHEEAASGADNLPPPFLVATNRINHPSTAEDILGQADMVSMARPFLADPDLIRKSRENREDEINTCIACNQACLDHVFVGKVASCLVNPRACHETQLAPPTLSNAERLSIGVIGAGPAGCAFSITAAQLGHTVTLYDKGDALGGQFNMAKRVPGKEEFHETIRYFATMLQRTNVKLWLETAISVDDMKSAEHDKWILASGVEPRDPKIPGQDHPNVLSYIDVLKHRKPVGERVAVIGAGGIGFDVSAYLLHWERDMTANEVDKEKFWEEWGIDSSLSSPGGLRDPAAPIPSRKIYLLQRKHGKLGAGLGKTTGWIHRASLNNSGAVEMMHSVKYERIDENGFLHVTQNGKSLVLEVDNIVICAGQVEKRDLYDEADEALKEKIYTIGGAYMAGELDAKRAIDMGTRLALRIHDTSVVPGKHAFKAETGAEEKMYRVLKRYFM
jgi:2,4-dienoyl-CoA reductase (NADPH2)